MGKTGHLTKSKVAKFDEFYTPRESVEKEIGAYVAADPDVFRGKVVYLPADRATGRYPSAFWEYFKENFLSLGLRKLIATCYKSVPGGDGDPEHGERATLTRSAEGAVVATHTLLEGDGDFRSYELHSDFLEADVVVTNPPFSRLKDLLEIVTLLGKEFLLVVPLVSLNYRRTFQLVWKKRAWFGATAIREFLMRNEDGTLTPVDVQTLWLTNLYHQAERKRLAPLRTMAENRERAKGKACEQMLYKRYDNYDAIEVSRLEYIPADYKGKIGVPITVLPYIARPLKGVVTEEARAAHRGRHFSHSEWERLWKPKYDPFYVWGLVDTQTTRAPRGGAMRDYWGLTLEGKVMFTRIILQWSTPTNSEHSSHSGMGSCRGVACYARTSAQSAAMSDENCGVNHPSVALPRIAGVARYAPTEEGKVGNDEKIGNVEEERRDADHLFDFYTHTHTIIGAANYSTADSRQQTAENVLTRTCDTPRQRSLLCGNVCQSRHTTSRSRGWQKVTDARLL